ncbi:YcnI family protein [Mycobacterium sp. Aquia_216]|uniref:YcnI family copper-binding membrane protein n=1 Tax=Mycobacterium sp. Aquia_216 TaxID=2991729 RepID=UPI00227A2EB3|nr:YcnI family protein [Mycobacterium sp. Aquia_216]WAJ45139.1 YcnI family protein [Mycobacterium sp. Aquia_216]
MPFHNRWISRALIVISAAAALYLGASGATPPAWAHVHASSDNATRGAMAIVTFQVPNESDKGAATTALTVTLPDVASARTEAMPGWTAKLDRDAASGVVHSVTWTAAPNGGIGVDQFALFRISVQLPDTDTVSFPATQTYADGSVVKWDQQPLPDGGEPEHPAPMLTLTAGPPTSHEHHHSGMPAGHAGTPTSVSADNIARVLGGAALVVAALGIVLVLVRRPRT